MIVVVCLTAFDKEITDHSIIHKIGYRGKAKPDDDGPAEYWKQQVVKGEQAGKIHGYFE